jgi:hypothetical protein
VQGTETAVASDRRFNGLSGWVSTKVKAPKPGTVAWKLDTKITQLHVVDVRGGRRAVHARPASDEEAATLWPRLIEACPPFQTYRERTDRVLPVLILGPR